VRFVDIVCMAALLIMRRVSHKLPGPLIIVVGAIVVSAGVDLWIARANGPLRQLLTATGLMKRLGAEHIHPSVRAAVAAYQAQFGTP
jgi:MFS superfamily sulfate permease-like transporter